jgi:hypothetical protein
VKVKSKAILQSALAGIVAAALSYSVLITPAELAALAIRRRIPDAWFSSSVLWYATAIVLGISVVTASVAFRIVYKRAAGTAPRHPE